jgi:hypothetical protein
MVTGRTSWEEETLARIKEAKNKQLEAQNLIEKAQEDVQFWSEYVAALEMGLNLDKERYKMTSTSSKIHLSEHFKQQSTWENLLDLMKDNNGILIVTDAVTILVEAGAFTEREHARNVIYSTLYSHKKEMNKIRHGVYQLKGESTNAIHVPVRTRIKKHSKRIKNDIAPLIKQLKNQNPKMTKNEVMKYLVDSGFDFKGKRPTNSLNMAWVRLGFNKEDKQQPLL